MTSQEDRSVPGLVIVPLEGDADGAVLGAWSRQRIVTWVPLFRDPVEKLPGRGSVITCVEYRRGVYRLLVEVSIETGDQWLYKFEPLPEGERATGLVKLDAAWLAAEAARRRKQSSYAAGAQASRYYAWALGWLPARVQERLAERHGFDAGGASAANGIIEFLGGMVLGGLSSASMFAGGLSGTGRPLFSLWLGPLAVMMLFEGVARWIFCRSSDEPKGLYLLEGADWVVRRVFR